MKKTLVNAILATSTAFVALMIISPLNHLSAQNEVIIDANQKVHKTSIIDVNFDSSILSVNIDGATIPVVTDASTTISLGNGNQTEFTALRPGGNVYVFGSYDTNLKSIVASKIVLRNKSKTERTTFSRAELERQIAASPAMKDDTNDLGLTLTKK
jgi:hypothetical protein